MKVEDHPAFAEKLPRICSILGGEKTPLKIGETFQFYSFYYHISEGGEVIMHDSTMETTADTLLEMVNHPEKIIRRPQFSEDEKALMREYAKFGYTILRKPKGYGMQIESEKGWIPLPDGMFQQITPENSPFNFAAYLESEAAK